MPAFDEDPLGSGDATVIPFLDNAKVSGECEAGHAGAGLAIQRPRLEASLR